MSEPRKFTIEIDEHEVYALVKFHCNQSRRIVKALGQSALKHKASSVIWSGRELKIMVQEATKLQEQHFLRAKGLASLIKT
jgi:hypothetical protein